MKRILLAAALVVAAVPLLAAEVGMSVSIGEPGFYSRIDIGDYPQPRVIYRQPIMARHVEVDREPIYMHVPPGHAKNWRKYCRNYNACDERVYFVQNNWYNREYVTHYQERNGGWHDGYREDGRDNHRNNWNNGNNQPGKHNNPGHNR